MGFMMPCKKYEDTIVNREIRDTFAESNRLMALAISSVPVLTGKVAERFVDICEYNSEHLACSQYSEEREKWVKKILKKSKEFKSEASGK